MSRSNVGFLFKKKGESVSKRLTGVVSEFLAFKQEIKESFRKMSEESNDHLDSINRNTNEIQSNYEFMCRINEKLDKLSSKINEIELITQEKTQKRQISYKTGNETIRFDLYPLTDKEKSIFMALYTIITEKTFVHYEDLANSLKVSETVAQEYITSLIEKGIPIAKKYFNQKVLLTIDKKFLELQTKQNILHIDDKIREYM